VALEILGYRFNRAPMLRIAGEWPLTQWAERQVEPASVYTADAEGWSLQGVRPANHPRNRLRQYAVWAQQRPDWPSRLVDLANTFPRASVLNPTPDTRRAERFTSLRETIAEQICANAIGGTRLNTLVCDGVFPLLAAHAGCDVEGLWHHWFCGDLPPWLTSGLRQLGFFDGRVQPASHGAAQGLLGWFLARELRR
jgi:hypothetical protein